MLSNDFYYLGLIVLFPLIGAFINGLFGAKLPKSWVGFIATGAMLASFFTAIMSVIVFHESGQPHVTYTVYEWIHTGSLHLDLAFLLDPLSSVMILVITGVGFLIHLYSTSYMAEDPAKWRYFAYLNIFVFAMLLLVLGKNMLVTFIGWEGVGACSYLLIGFWYTDDEKAAAGQKAFIVNRVGDFAFILGILLLYTETGTFDYLEINAMLASTAGAAKLAPIAIPAVLLIFIGCTGKSAQIPLYTWLPDAMAGPTPVSALIHAATMVTSGIFLLSRLNGLVTMSWEVMAVIALVGAFTAFFAATIAFVQTDIKKVLAYSTVSQLGYMFLAIGCGSFVGAVFHLMTHAFFKALLFLGSGSVIHAMGGEQDIRKMGGLKKYMPVTRMTFLIGCVAIAGLPLMGAGFFSKDLILWSAVSNVHIGQIAGIFSGLPDVSFLTTQVVPAIAQGAPLEVMMPWKIIYGLVTVLGFVTAGMTAFYMFRLYFLTFEGECRADDHTKKHLHESPMAITIPLTVLAILSIIGGWTGWPHVLAHLAPPSAEHFMLAFEHWLAPVFELSSKYRMANAYGADYGKQELLSMLAGSVMAISGVALAYLFYLKRPSYARGAAEKYRTLHETLMNKYYVDEAYNFLFVRGTINAGKASYEADQKIIDGLMVDGTGFMARSFGEILRHLQGGDVQKYAVYLVLAITVAFMTLVLV
jgi:NADH-quinone oxidoreductase subunit L